MRIEQQIHVSRPPDAVWEFLKDVPAVAACIPGAELTDVAADNTFRGAFRLKVGPLSAKIEGDGRLERDDDARTGKIEGKGVDRRGGSRVSATMSYQVEPEADGTRVLVVADLTLAGQLSQIGRTGLIEDVARRLTEEFSQALAKRLAEAPPSASMATEPSFTAGSPEPAKASEPAAFDAGRAVGASLWNRICAWFRQLFGR
jgi:carbon monoxide dehydrogenase subunit G